MVWLAGTGIAISMGATSAVTLPAETNAEAFASPTLHALTTLIQVEPVVLRDSPDLGTNKSEWTTVSRFAVSFPVVAPRAWKTKNKTRKMRRNRENNTTSLPFLKEFMLKEK
jgi:hypothetical protein